VESVLRAFVCAVGVVSAAWTAHADPTVLRLAAIAPDGTNWARDLRAFGREAEAASSGQLQVKWYFGGIAGDEMASLERVRRGQLDGVAGAAVCERLAPSLRVTRVPGVFLKRDEQNHVLARLRPQLVEEFRNAGFELLGLAHFGSDILFTREPVRTFAELKQQRLWVWDTDTAMRQATALMGLSLKPLPVTDVRAQLDAGQLDGLIALPSAALAYQWSTRVKYFIDLRVGSLPGCIMLASRTFERLPSVLKDDLREAGARLAVRFDDGGSAMDEALVGGLFEKQGLIKLPASETLRAAFFQSARAAREKLAGDVLPHDLLQQVLGWLADYRAEHSR